MPYFWSPQNKNQDENWTDSEIRKKIKDIVNIQLSGNTKVRIIDKKQENYYKLAKAGEKKVRVQDEIYKYLKRELDQRANTNNSKQII